MLNVELIKNFLKIIGNNAIHHNFGKVYIRHTEPRNICHSSNAIKQPFDIFDIFTDLLKYKCENATPEKPTTVTYKTVTEKRVLPTPKVEKIDEELDVKHITLTGKLIANELNANMTNKKWSEVNNILRFYTEKQVALPHDLVLSIANSFSDHGYNEGLISLRELCEVTTIKDDHLQRGVLLHYMAKSYWVRGNVVECVKLLTECCNKYPSLIDNTKIVLKKVIPEAVAHRSKAELTQIMDFVKYFTSTSNDYYPFTLLWECLFMSEWHTDHEVADSLLENEQLQRCISLLTMPFTHSLLRSRRETDVYRFMQTLLKYKLTDSFKAVMQILFDHYCWKKDKNRCAEIIQSSLILNVPLRQEQYDQFISWNVNGNPLKLIKKSQIEKIHSTFE